MLKSRACDAMTGAGGSISRWGSELRERNGLGRPDAGWCMPLGKSSRNNEVDSYDARNRAHQMEPFGRTY